MAIVVCDISRRGTFLNLPLWIDTMHEVAGEIEVYGSLEPSSSRVALHGEDAAPVMLSREVGRGRVAFAAGPFGYDLVTSRDNEERTVARRIEPSPLSAIHVSLLTNTLTELLGTPASLVIQKPLDQDLEVNARRRPDGSWLILTTNWSQAPVSIVLQLGQGAGRLVEGFAHTPAGVDALTPREVADLGAWKVSLKREESRVVRVTGTAGL